MTLVNGHVQFGGWTIHLQAAINADPYGYDQPAAKYNDPATVYNDGSRAAMWTTIDCQVTHVVASHGGRQEQIPGVRARLGRLTADLHDPARVLDPDATAYELLTRPGVGVRLVAVNPGGTAYPLWTGIADTFEHDLLTGEGKLEASDLVALFTGVDVSGWVRPAESGEIRLRACLAVMPNPIQLTYTGTAPALSGAQFSGDLWSAVVNSTAEAEQSIVWVDQSGRLRRTSTAGLGAPVRAVDCDDGTAPIIYTRLSSMVDEARLANLLTVERVNLTGSQREREPLKYARTTSVSHHGPHTLTETRLALPNDTALHDWAVRVLDLRAYPQPGITGLGVTITDLFPWVARTVPAVVALSVGSVLDVELSSRGAAGAWTVAVASIEHTITPDDWEVRLDVADGPDQVRAADPTQLAEAMAWQ